jgi:purine-binding chemotaxis protein CheW
MNSLPTVRENVNQASHEVTQLVSFELGGEEYGIDVLTVREIIRIPTVTRMPNTADYVDGIINLRGTVVPIISLRRRFGLMECEQDRRNRILVMETGGGLTGFVVDAVAEVIRVSAADIQPPPGAVQGKATQDCITGVISHGERLLITLDIDRLFNDAERSALAALE